jgi:hypothetical protein
VKERRKFFLEVIGAQQKRFSRKLAKRRREKSTWQGNEEKANKGMKMTKEARSSS